MVYKHTQIGYLMIYVLLAVILLFAGILIQGGVDSSVLVIMLIVIVILASFSTLNVMVDSTHLRVKFGFGIYKKQFVLSEIISARAVTNRWFYGWGIRLWLWPKMWIYNVSGFDAVEIKLKDGKSIRIGTDEPKLLEKEISQAIK